MGTTTYMDGKSESESLMEGGGQNSSRGSIALDDENGKEPEKRKSGRVSKRVNAKKQKRGCMENVRQMMCNHRIISQREMYEKQVRQNDALSESYREAA